MTPRRSTGVTGAATGRCRGPGRCSSPPRSRSAGCRSRASFAASSRSSPAASPSPPYVGVALLIVFVNVAFFGVLWHAGADGADARPGGHACRARQAPGWSPAWRGCLFVVVALGVHLPSRPRRPAHQRRPPTLGPDADELPARRGHPDWSCRTGCPTTWARSVEPRAAGRAAPAGRAARRFARAAQMLARGGRALRDACSLAEAPEPALVAAFALRGELVVLRAPHAHGADPCRYGSLGESWPAARWAELELVEREGVKPVGLERVAAPDRARCRPARPPGPRASTPSRSPTGRCAPASSRRSSS